MKSKRLVLALVFTLPLVALAQGPAKPRVSVRTALDRTAVWIGDRVQYTLEFSSPDELDVLVEDLSKERLPVQGGEVLGVETSEEERPSGRIRRLRYTLTTYAVDRGEISIDSFPVRYFARRTIGSGTQTAPLGEVTVPRTVIPIRSTLPDQGRLPEPRAPASLRLVPQYVRWAHPAGLALVAIAIIPVALLVLNVAAGLRRLRAAAPRFQQRRQNASAVDELLALEPGSADARVEAFGRLEHLVREHLQMTAGIPALALTPGEIAEALKGRTSWPVETIESLLLTCERARYAPHPSSAGDWQAAVSAASEVVRRRRV